MATATSAKDKAGDAADRAKDAAGDAAEATKDKAKNSAKYAEDKANQGVQAVGDYLSKHDVRDMAEDLTNLVKKHPLMSVAVGVGVGLLLASLTRR